MLPVQSEKPDGELPLTPEQHLTVKVFPDIERQAFACLVKLPSPAPAADKLRQVLQTLARRHDAFRLFFTREDGAWRQWIADETPPLDLTLASSLDGLYARPAIPVGHPPLARAVTVDTGTEQYLYLALSHLVFDGLSLHHLLRELEALLQGRSLGANPRSFERWVRRLSTPLDPDEATRLRAVWESQKPAAPIPLPAARRPGDNRLETVRSESMTLDMPRARAAVRTAREVVRPDVLTLAALLQAYRATLGPPYLHLCLTHNGRTENAESISMTSGMLGLVVTHYYVVLEAPDPDASLTEAYAGVLGQLTELPAPSTFGRVYESTDPQHRETLSFLSDQFATFTFHSSKTGARYTCDSFEEVELPHGPPRTGHRTPDFSLIVEAGAATEPCRVTCVYSPASYDAAAIAGWLARTAEIMEGSRPH